MKSNTVETCARVLALAAAVCAVLPAQIDSRADELLAERAEKARDLGAEVPSKIERQFLRFQETRLMERLSEGASGLHAKLGGLVQGSGFAIGPEYSRELAGGNMNLRASAQASARGYQKFDAQLSVPHLATDRVFIDLYAVRHNYPRLDYYGSGPDSDKTGRSDYRLEDAAFDATIGTRPFKGLTLGSTLGYVRNNIGRGTDSRFVSAEQIYSPKQAPGIDVQAGFLRLGSFAQYDYRDFAPGPRSGGNYFVQFSNFHDRNVGLHDFRRLDAELQQYVPVLNKRRVIAVRARTSLTFHEPGQTAPFFMQPTLGGSDDLRGYRPFRFRGDHLMVMNAEYRWEVFSGLDMAVFGDAGKVFNHKSEFNLRHLESAAGFGFRFNARNTTFLRLDVGFSHEGFQVFVKFNNLFGKGPLRTSSSQGDF